MSDDSNAVGSIFVCLGTDEEIRDERRVLVAMKKFYSRNYGVVYYLSWGEIGKGGYFIKRFGKPPKELVNALDEEEMKKLPSLIKGYIKRELEYSLRD